MRRVINLKLPTAKLSVELDEAEATHAHRVLRLGNGDELEVFDAQGGAVIASLRFQGKKCFLDFVRALEPEPSGVVVPFVLRSAVLKGEAMEWMIEKCVELGVSRFAPFISDHTVIQLGRKGPEEFRERWQRVADQALKQCGRRHRLLVDGPQPFAQAVERAGSLLPQCAVFFADEQDALRGSSFREALQEKCSKANDSSSVELWIGPEGGWSVSERELLYRFAQPISLGPLILRAETAAISGCALASEYLRNRS